MTVTCDARTLSDHAVMAEGRVGLGGGGRGVVGTGAAWGVGGTHGTLAGAGDRWFLR